MRNQYDIFSLPKRLFKYYGFDKSLNIKRLSGVIYLASPLEFNDPCDCQREVINNSTTMVDKKGEEWLRNKLIEMGYTTNKATSCVNGLIKDDKAIVNEVHQKQLEKAGILCLTCNNSDSLMWGYYTNNKGFCLEYDVNMLIQNLIIEYVNELDYVTTRLLFLEKLYCDNPIDRAMSVSEELLALSESLFDDSCLDRISNSYLMEHDRVSCLYFIRNVFLKRFVAQSIVYGVKPDGAPSDLFFDGDVKRISSKYFVKTSSWSLEQEFRLFFSLGGRKALSLGTSIIKNVYLGCNMSDEDVVSTAYSMASLGSNASLYKMQRLPNGGLQPAELDVSSLKEGFMIIKQKLSDIR